MRHLWSFLAGVVAAPLSWILIALGQDGSARTITNWVDVGTFNTANMIGPTVYLAVTGILLGLVGTLRFSPLGALTAGLLLAGPYVGLLFAPFRVRDQVPNGGRIFGDPLPLRLPLENGTLFLIGVLLLMAVFSIQRWRPWPDRIESAIPQTPAAVAPDNDQPTVDWLRPERARTEADTGPLTLGYPEPGTGSLPQAGRRDGESPWVTPPRPAPRPDGASH